MSVLLQAMTKGFLDKLGLGFYQPNDFTPKEVILRDGKHATVWVHNQNGHGILDEEFWDDGVLGAYYEGAYREEFNAAIEEKEIKSEQHLEIYKELNKKQFELIQPYLTKNANYLEIGCSFGGVLRNVVNQGARSYTVVEPNKNDANFIRESNPQVEVHNSTFQNSQLEPGKYDVIASFEVLEHVVSVKDFLLNCTRLISESGQLIIEVPNHDDVLLSQFKAKKYKDFYYHKAHIHYFSARSLKEICSAYGFLGDVSSLVMYPFYNHIFWAQNNKPQGNAEQALEILAPTTHEAINRFYKKCASDYEVLINDLGLGDCLVFSGIKSIQK